MSTSRETTIPTRFARGLLGVSHSSGLALGLVLVVMVFSVAGVLLPQEGRATDEQIRQWRGHHPAADAVAGSLGLYNVFQSWGFLAVLAALAVNTLSCTIRYGVQNRDMLRQPGDPRSRWAGFVVLHGSLVLLIAGGIVSGSTRRSGRIVLTEGQTFDEGSRNYEWLAEGPLRLRRNEPLTFTLDRVSVEYRKGRVTAVSSHIRVQPHRGNTFRGEVRVNRPLTVEGAVFTQGMTGYAPGIVIRDLRTQTPVCDAFLALKATRTKAGVLHRDVIPLPLSKHPILLTLYPSHAGEGAKAVPTGESPDSPLLIIETGETDSAGSSRTPLPLGGRVTVGLYAFEFTDLRRWASFDVARDPGYRYVLWALWGGVLGLLLRYVPELNAWFKEDANGTG